MAYSATDVANEALVHLGGVPAFLADVTTDVTKAGKLINQVLDTSRKAVLRTHPWSFATVPATVEPIAITGAADNGAGLIRITATTHGRTTGDYVTVADVVGTTEANTQWVVTVINANTLDLQASTFTNAYVSGGVVGLAPDHGFLFSLPLPASFVRLVSIADVEWSLSEGRLFTDATSVELTYVKDVSDYTKMDPLFYEALACYIAWKISYALTQSNTVKTNMWQAYKMALSKARHTDSLEKPLHYLESFELLEARITSTSRFIRDPGT